MASQQLAQVLDHSQALGDNISDMGEEADILQIRATRIVRIKVLFENVSVYRN